MKIKLDWKIGSAIGFVSFASVYVSSVYLGNITALSDLGALVNIGLSFTSGLMGSLCSPLYKCIKNKIADSKNKETQILQTLLQSDSLGNAPIYSSDTVMNKAMHNISMHVASCNQLIKRYTILLAQNNVDEIIKLIAEAKSLKENYLKVHSNDAQNYFEILKMNGYEHSAEPLEILANHLTAQIDTEKQNAPRSINQCLESPSEVINNNLMIIPDLTTKETGKVNIRIP